LAARIQMPYLWSKIEAQIAGACKLILDKERYLLRQAQLDFT
jgi:hypothetical protein